MWIGWLISCTGGGPATVPAPEVVAPFQWRARVNGELRPVTASSSDLHQVEGWTCGYQIDPLETEGDVQLQFGVVACEHGSGVAFDSVVLCRIEGDSSDCGSGNLRLATPGHDEIQVALTCETPASPCSQPDIHADHVPLPRMPGGLGMRVNSEEEPTREAASAFRYQVQSSTGSQPATKRALEGRRQRVAVGLDGFACDASARPAADPAYPGGEIGRLQCAHAGSTIASEIPCVRVNDARTCQMGSLRFTDGERTQSLTLTCKGVSDPGCF